MIAFAIPAVPLLIRIGTHAAAAVLGAAAYANREHLSRLPFSAHRSSNRSALTEPHEIVHHAHLHAELRALHGQLQEGLDGLRAEVRESRTLLVSLSARQDALEHLLEARDGAESRGAAGDGEVRPGRRGARTAAARAAS